MHNLPIEIKRHFDKYVVGQDILKKRLAMCLYKYVNYNEREPLLIIGPSGCGKTFIISLIKKFKAFKKDFTVFIYDASSLTPNGFQGDNADDILKKYGRQCLKEGNSTHKGIIYLDEIDKIIMPNTDSKGENVNGIVQYQIMNFLQGNNSSIVDTSKILFVLGGAFTQLEQLEQKKNSNAIFGFAPEGNNNSLLDESSLRENLIKIGGQREFIARIPSIVRLNALSAEELKAILLHPTRGVLSRKQMEFERDDLSLVVDDVVIDEIVNNIVNEKLGARSVNNIIDNLIGTYDYEMISQGYSSMRIHKGVLNGELPFFDRSK